MGQDLLSDSARNELKTEAGKHDSWESFVAKVKGWAMDVWRQEPAEGLSTDTTDELSEVAAVHDTPTNWMQAMGHQAEMAWSRVRRDNDPEIPGDHLHGTHQPAKDAREDYRSGPDGVSVASGAVLTYDGDQDLDPKQADKSANDAGEKTAVVVTGTDQQVSEPTGVPSGALGDLTQGASQEEVPSYDGTGAPLNEAARAAQRRSEDKPYGVSGLVPPSS